MAIKECKGWNQSNLRLSRSLVAAIEEKYTMSLLKILNRNASIFHWKQLLL